MNIDEQKQNIELAKIIHHHLNIRHLGHTTAMLNGAKKAEATVLVHNRVLAYQILSDCKNPSLNVITKDDVFQHKMKGLRTPLLIDHYVLVSILEALLIENKKLKDKHYETERTR